MEQLYHWLKVGSFMGEELYDGFKASHVAEIIQDVVELRYLPRYLMDTTGACLFSMELQ